MKKILIIQTAFIGDVILATGLIEKLKQNFQDAEIDMLVRKGNESLLQNNPHLRNRLIWDKKTGKIRNLIRILGQIRRNKYDIVVNVHRFASSGFLTGFSGAKERIGFIKNPLSWLFTKKVEHKIGQGHEVDRNQALIAHLMPDDQGPAGKPKLYPATTDYERVMQWSKNKPYITLSPASVWFTKQFPPEKWVELIENLPSNHHLYLLGGPGDKDLVNSIIEKVTLNKTAIKNLCGELSFLQSAALMSEAAMNYVNDSAPLHMASAMNAPVTAIFCSTVPEFGFTPLSDRSTIVEVEEKLTCRPCGLHGKRECPEGHFKCALDIKVEKLLEVI
ncbi:MAG: glycosyltransferase family 9 protein [Chitinophagaceae bacterium]|nr:glycosyltransferase family 9 protein [Chitinophagaceae bacterium]